MSKPKDQPTDAAEAGHANSPVSDDRRGATRETEMDDEESVDDDSDDDADAEMPEPGETRAPELPDETLAERD